jgi:hypothetical protein
MHVLENALAVVLGYLDAQSSKTKSGALVAHLAAAEVRFYWLFSNWRLTGVQ